MHPLAVQHLNSAFMELNVHVAVEVVNCGKKGLHSLKCFRQPNIVFFFKLTF